PLMLRMLANVGAAASPGGTAKGRLGLVLQALAVGVAGAERLDTVIRGIEGVSPDAADVVGEQMERNRGLFTDRDHAVDVAVWWQQIVETATLEQATLDNLKCRLALLPAVVDAPVDRLGLLA